MAKIISTKTIKVARSSGVTLDNEAVADLFKIKGFKEAFGVHKSILKLDFLSNKDEYTVTELSTGMLVVQGETNKKRAIAKAEIRMLSNILIWDDIKSKSIAKLKENRNVFPMNEFD